MIKRPIEWRAIPGYEGIYSVTRDGRVWAHERTTKHNSHKGYQVRKGKWLRWNPSGKYPAVWLYDLSCDTAHGRMHHIHKLVMAVWGPPKPSPEHEINHKDLDKMNNRIDNLEWVTALENRHHAIDNGHFSPPPVNFTRLPGSVWITNDSENRRLPPDQSIPNGWRRGITRHL